MLLIFKSQNKPKKVTELWSILHRPHKALGELKYYTNQWPFFCSLAVKIQQIMCNLYLSSLTKTMLLITMTHSFKINDLPFWENPFVFGELNKFTILIRRRPWVWGRGVCIVYVHDVPDINLKYLHFNSFFL